jgi:CheY-like chemotaxis protein
VEALTVKRRRFSYSISRELLSEESGTMEEMASKKVIPLFESIPPSARRNRALRDRKKTLRGRIEEYYQVAGMRKVALAVDDDSVFVELLWEVLRHRCDVIVAFNGLEAIEAYLRWREHIDLIVTGLVMPIMDGDELAARVRRVDLDLPIIVVSGCYEKLDLLKKRDDLVTMRKPFTVRDLEDAVDSCLRR